MILRSADFLAEAGFFTEGPERLRCQPNGMIEPFRAEEVVNVAFNISSQPVEGIHPCKQPLFPYRPRFGIEPGPECVLAIPKLSPLTKLPSSYFFAIDNHSHSHSIMNERLNL